MLYECLECETIFQSEDDYHFPVCVECGSQNTLKVGDEDE